MISNCDHKVTLYVTISGQSIPQCKSCKKLITPVRSIIRAPKGKVLLAHDLSAAESWVVAHLANDQNMKRELDGGDLHSYSACLVYTLPVDLSLEKKERYKHVSKTQRYIGKKTNHSKAYRTSPRKGAEFINKEGGVTVSEAQVKVWFDRWDAGYNLRYWWNEIDSKLNKDRTLITTYGRKRIFYGLWNNDLLKEATAYEPQSTVADHMNGNVHDDLGIEGGILTVKNKIFDKHSEIKGIQTAHDSLLTECPEEIAEEVGEQITDILRRPLIVNGEMFTIPVDFDIYDHRWTESISAAA